ncbi:MAG: hypothetical protein ABSC64_19645, partial [Candidatus Korobacteraceae bacterium]
ARTQLSSVERSSVVNVRAVGYLLMPHHGIDRFSMQLSTRRVLGKLAIAAEDIHSRSYLSQVTVPKHS